MKKYSKERQAISSALDGRGQNAAYTAGARTAEPIVDRRGYSTSEADFYRQRWNDRQNVATVTRTASGRMSVNGRTQGGSTWTMTPKNDDGSPVINEKTGKARQSGRSKIATRRQREYDVRKGMNNISPRTIQAWLDNGMAQVVDGSMVGANGHVITRKADGNYSMGLATG